MDSQNNDLLEQQILREENCGSLYTRYAGIARAPNLARMFQGFAHQAQEHANQLRSILREQGGTVDGVVQNRATQESMLVSASHSVPGGPGGSSQTMLQDTGVPGVRGTDEDMIDDALLATSSMSESYRRAVTQTGDERVCAALIGMRRDEDNQKQTLARYFSGQG